MYTKPVLIFFTAGVVGWLVAYFGVIHRGFKDRALGIPVGALATNLSWEAIYSFVYRPYSNIGHILSIPWFAVDLIIAAQCLMYGGNDAEDPFLRKYFKGIFVVALCIAFPTVYLVFTDIHDWYAEYTGAGATMLMSVLFIALLFQRKGAAAQSIYIAIFKWLGTFFAWVAIAFKETTTLAHPWPASLGSFFANAATHEKYPLNPLINTIYLIVFFLDVIYILMLRVRLRECGFSVWRRI